MMIRNTDTKKDDNFGTLDQEREPSRNRRKSAIGGNRIEIASFIERFKGKY